MKSKEKVHFDKIADEFDTRFNTYSGIAAISRAERRMALFSRHCLLKEGRMVLELGCGTGEYTRRLFEYTKNVYSVDISLKMLQKAVHKFTSQQQPHWIISDIENLSIKDGAFDAVVGNSILHHVDVEKTLPHIYRVLKKGGKVAFSEPNISNPYVFFQKKIPLLKRLSGDSLDETAFSRWQMHALFVRAGFKEVSVKPFDFLHPATPSCLVNCIRRLGLVFEKVSLLKEIAGSLLITGVK